MSVSVNEGVKFNNWKTKENSNETEVINALKTTPGAGEVSQQVKVVSTTSSNQPEAFTRNLTP